MRQAVPILVTLMMFAATAQAAEVVPAKSGYPALTQEMLDRASGFVEWAMGVQFTPAQRAAQQRLAIDHWTNGEAKDIGSMLELLDLERQTMHQLSGLSREEAEARLLGRLEKELVREQGAMVMRFEREAIEKTQTKAKEMLITAVQRFAAAHTAESTTSTVDIPSDEMKGRIIGREGRNIRAFEKATGVDVIIDDTPGVDVRATKPEISPACPMPQRPSAANDVLRSGWSGWLRSG